jgi:astacin (peptidase family M12A)
MRRRTALVIALALAAFGAVAPSASAFERVGRPWPGGRITYFTAAANYSSSVDRAARIWNRTNVGVKFVKASRRNAAVVVDYGGRRCEGAAFAGFIGRRRQSPVQLGAGCGRSLIVLTAVHEFGHVLGLGHENDKCARMNPAFDGSGTPQHCRPRSLAYWLAHPLVSDDLQGARRTY